MEINMKGYNLESFKEKDIYTWEEIVAVIEDLEYQVEALQEETKDLKDKLNDPDYGKPDPHDIWVESRY